MSARDSRRVSIQDEAIVYVTSEPQENEWGQPAASRYVFAIEGTRLYGQLIAGVYVSQSYTYSIDSCLAAELEAWDAASDEALANFEAMLD